MAVLDVIKKLFPVAFAETGFGITRSKAIFASGDVDFELLQAAAKDMKMIHAAQFINARVDGKCIS